MNIYKHGDFSFPIISYQAITGNNNKIHDEVFSSFIISYQAITGNNNLVVFNVTHHVIISYQAITGNNNNVASCNAYLELYHTKR